MHSDSRTLAAFPVSCLAAEEAVFVSDQMVIHARVLVDAPYPLGNDGRYFLTWHWSPLACFRARCSCRPSESAASCVNA